LSTRRPRNYRPGEFLELLEDRRMMDAALPPPGGGGHGGDPVLEAEHQAVMNLVPYAAVTHTAIASGDWDEVATWDNGIPVAGANVLIKTGVTVELDTVQRQVLRTLRIDGTLTFATDVNTGLMVDTIVVDKTGVLLMGTEGNPVRADVEAKIIIADRGAIDTSWDPLFFSRGLISHGQVSMYGAEITSYVAAAGAMTKGSTQIVLASTPEGWKVGDRIIVSGTNPHAREDEELKILGISGNVVTVSPLAFNHVAPDPSYSIYVANVARNVVIESQNPYMNARRGHVMFMHTPAVDIHFAGFYGLGRTDKRNPLHNPVLDANGKLEAGSGKNPVGRYSVHFHRTGLHEGAGAARIAGSAVVDSPGWGIVNHSSNVDVIDNVVFDVVGAAFVTEVGNEIGSFRNNLAIRSRGSGAGIESRQDRQDFGHQGDGFWFQGAGIEVEGNIAVGQRHAGFVYFTRGLVEKGLGTARFDAHNLVDPTIAGGAELVEIGIVPIRLFLNNTTYASGTGFESWFHQLNSKHTSRSVVENLTVWNTRSGTGMFTPYTNQMTIKNSTILGNVNRPGGTGIGRNDVTRNMVYDNLRIEGWRTGIAVPVNGTNTIQNGTFNNVRAIEITTANSRSRVVNINGDIKFGTLSPLALKGETQYDIFLRSNFNPMERDITRLFNPDVIRLGTVNYNGKQLYYLEQAADFVPFKVGEAAEYVPAEFLGKTNQQLWDQYGLAIGGIVAPANATTDPRIRGLIGDPATYLPDLYLTSRKYTNQLNGYVLTYKDATGTRFTDPTPVNLREGWNLITRNLGGHARTFLVFGDVTGPTFTLDPNLSMKINPLDLKEGFTVRGTVSDNSTGTDGFYLHFANLDQLPLQTRPDGSLFVVLRFTIRDRAGNLTDVALELTVDPMAPRLRDIGFVDLPERSVSVTLVALLGFKDDRPA
jgi:hypothetical protein